MHDTSSNVFRDSIDKIQIFWRTNKRGLINQLITSFFVTWGITFGIALWLQDPLLRGKTLILAKAFSLYFKVGFVFHLLLYLAVNVLLINIRRATAKSYHKDKERNINIADNSPDKLLQTAEDLAVYYDIGSIDEVDNNIFGCIDGEYKGFSSLEIKAGKQLVAMHNDMIDENMNLICFGLSGAGKSRKKVINDILQIIKRGESFVCTDTKGALVSILYFVCKMAGYTVKIVNHKPNELIYSDGVDFFGMIGRYSDIKKIEDTYERDQAINIAKSNCDDIAECILTNLSDDVKTKHEDFWSKEGKSYICFWVNFVFFNEAIPEDEKHFGTINKYLKYYKVRHANERGDAPEGGTFLGYIDDLIYEIKANPVLEKTCLYYFTNFLGGTDTVKDSVHNGLQVDLKVFDDELLCKITSKDEIDLSLPAKKKCAYFFVIDTLSEKNKFITATTFMLMYKKLYSYIESKPNQQADVPVWIIYDEFLNIGVVPKITKILQTARSYLIRHELFVQTLSDFAKVYDENDMESILSNCAYWLLVKTEEMELLKRFSEKSGVMNEVQVQERKSVNRLNLLKDMQTDIQEGTTMLQRAVLLESEIRKLKDYEMLLSKAGADIAKIHTWDYTNHPLAQNLEKYNTAQHMPYWKMVEIKEAKRIEEEAKARWNTAN